MFVPTVKLDAVVEIESAFVVAWTVEAVSPVTVEKFENVYTGVVSVTEPAEPVVVTVSAEPVGSAKVAVAPEALRVVNPTVVSSVPPLSETTTFVEDGVTV